MVKNSRKQEKLDHMLEMGYMLVWPLAQLQ